MLYLRNVLAYLKSVILILKTILLMNDIASQKPTLRRMQNIYMFLPCSCNQVHF